MSKIAQLQRRTYEIVEKAEDGDRVSLLFDIVVMVLVVGNSLAVVAETVPSVARAYPEAFRSFEVLCVTVFTLELVLRFFCAGADRRYAGLRGRLRFLTRPLVLIDILAVLPFFLPWIVALDARALQSLRLFRLLRLLKMGRYLQSAQLLGRVVRDRRDQLLATLFMAAILAMVAASLMFAVENEAQPGVFSSIPMALWWAVATLTTVGYGDIYPVTALGRALGAVMAVLGVGMFALPAGIIGSGFAEELAKMREAKAKKRGGAARACPHCGGALDAGAEAPQSAPQRRSDAPATSRRDGEAESVGSRRG